MKLSVPIRIAFTLVVVAAALWAATNKRLYDIAVFNVLVSMGLAAIIVLHLSREFGGACDSCSLVGW